MAPTQTISLDVSRRNDRPPVVWLGQGDRNGTTLRVEVNEDGRPYDCTGLTPYVVTPLCRWEGTASGNIATVPIDESALGEFSGTIGDAYMSLESEDMATSTQRFCVVVIPVRTEEPEEPADGEPANPDEPNDPGEPNDPDEPENPAEPDEPAEGEPDTPEP